MIQIEKNVPLAKKTKGRPAKYPFADMDVGDSIFVEGETTLGRAYIAAQVFGRRHGLCFTGKTEKGGVRIWRVES